MLAVRAAKSPVTMHPPNRKKLIVPEIITTGARIAVPTTNPTTPHRESA